MVGQLLAKRKERGDKTSSDSKKFGNEQMKKTGEGENP